VTLSGSAPASDPSIVEITDERHAIAGAALDLIAQSFDRRDRQSLVELRSEIAEKRLDLLAAYDFHLLASAAEDGSALGSVAGVYLEGVNAGFVTYLAVRPEGRGHGLGRALRLRLVEVFRADARRAGWDDLAWVLGEVRLESAWLRRLVDHRGALPFDLTYYHPGMRPGDDHRPYALYRQPVGDDRSELPAQLVRRILYAVYRRGYRVRYPLEHEGFAAMLDQLDGRDLVGLHTLFSGRPE
jgi:ribosomal protein S18 acetylase RimI-like enzyme